MPNIFTFDGRINRSDATIAAWNYAETGFPAFPCKRNESPLTPRGVKDATLDGDILEGWFEKWPHALIGMPTGKRSGIDVLSIDVNGFKSVPSWQKLSPLIVGTPSGGMDFWFKSSGVVPNTTNQIASGVNTWGEGGYVILPSS